MSRRHVLEAAGDHPARNLEAIFLGCRSAAVPAVGVGDAGEPGAVEDADDQVADRGVGIRLASGADLLEIFAECLVPQVMLAVFDGPVVAGVAGQVAGAGW